VVTGGTALLAAVERLAEKVFELPSRVGMPGASGSGFQAVAEPLYATCVGLLLEAGESNSSGARRSGVTTGGWKENGWLRRFGEWLQDFL
jgi:cell division protein FtsA